MNWKYLYTIAIATSLLAMSACTTSDDDSENANIPTGALPSAEFSLNNLPDEPYAEDAIRIETQDEAAPFYALELMSDGHYLLNTTRPKYTFKRAKSARTDDGTISLSDGEYYGEFSKVGAKRYKLRNGDEIDLMNATGSEKTVTYTRGDGGTSVVYVDVSEPIADDATRSLCRTWDYNSFELWAYWNSIYIYHGKQTIVDGKVESDFKTIGDNYLDYDEDDDEELFYEIIVPYKMVFTTTGTYLCFYTNGETLESLWQWEDATKGIMFYNRSVDENSLYTADGNVSIRFAGNQMRIYEDYNYYNEGYKFRYVIVNTLTAAN
jgi:hypothetical protein